MKKFFTKIIIRIFKNVKPFSLEYERMDGSLYCIGIRFNKFKHQEYFGLYNSFAFMLGKNFKAFHWIDN